MITFQIKMLVKENMIKAKKKSFVLKNVDFQSYCT